MFYNIMLCHILFYFILFFSIVFCALRAWLGLVGSGWVWLGLAGSGWSSAELNITELVFWKFSARPTHFAWHPPHSVADMGPVCGRGNPLHSQRGRPPQRRRTFPFREALPPSRGYDWVVVSFIMYYMKLYSVTLYYTLSYSVLFYSIIFYCVLCY